MTGSHGAGHRVFRSDQAANEYGIASTSFELAEEVNEGRYVLRATLDGATPEVFEREVSVERYALPRFTASVTLDSSYYTPGAQVRGVVDARYVFGQPVSGGRVSVETFRWQDEAWVTDRIIDVETDAGGMGDFEFALPLALAPQPGGRFAVPYEVTIEEPAGQSQTLSRTLLVTDGELHIGAAPESARLARGVPNDTVRAPKISNGIASGMINRLRSALPAIQAYGQRRANRAK